MDSVYLNIKVTLLSDVKWDSLIALVDESKLHEFICKIRRLKSLLHDDCAVD